VVITLITLINDMRKLEQLRERASDSYERTPGFKSDGRVVRDYARNVPAWNVESRVIPARSF